MVENITVTMENRRRVVLGVIITLVIILIAAATVFAVFKFADKHKEHGVCDISQEVSQIDPKMSKNIASSDGVNLFNMNGYLEFMEDHRSGFLPLRLREVHPGDTTAAVELESECVSLQISISYASDFVHIDMIDVGLIRGQQSSVEKEPLCTVNNARITFPLKDRFSCLGTIAFHCSRKEKDARGSDYNKPVAQLVFNKFEIEVQGDRDLIRSGEFSKPPAGGGCNVELWDIPGN